MKKALLIAVALAVVMAWTVPAMAIDWSASGFMAVVGNYSKNVGSGLPPEPPSGPFGMPPRNSQSPYWTWWGTEGVPPGPGADQWNDDSAYVRMKSQLNVTARASEDLYGVFTFNFMADRWGDEASFDGGDIGSWFGHSDGAIAVRVQDMYIDFRVPPKLPIWLRVGIQPFAIRPHVFELFDGPGITGRVVIDPIGLTIRPMWGKIYEGLDYDDDDADAFGVDMNIPIGPVKVGGFFWYENANDPGAQAWFGALDVSGNTDDWNNWWLGVYADGKIGPVGMQFDFIYNGGEYNVDTTAPWGWPEGWGVWRDFDIKAWLLRGELNMMVNKLMFGVGGLYATGENFGTPDRERFNVSLGNHASKWAGPNQDFFLLTGGFLGMVPSMQPTNSFIGAPGSSLGGVWYAKVFAQYMVTDWFRVGVNTGWLGDTSKHGNTFGSAFDPSKPAYARDDDDIGWEIDAGFNVQLYKNLSFGFGFGYLFAGDALDVWNTTTGTNDSPQDPWMFNAALCYMF